MFSNTSPVVPEEIALSLKCSLCNCYLSVGPIKTSTDGTKFQCGRCNFSDPNITVRSFSYEKLAKFLTFPCIYEYCQNKIPWDLVQQHELTCPYRTIQCPFTDCDVILCSEVIDHFNIHHTSAVIDNFICYNLNMPSTTYMRLLVHEDTPFFCHITRDGKTFKTSVYSINNIKYQRYQINLFTYCNLEVTKKQVSMLGEKIIPYNDKEHCIKCYMRNCNMKLHKHAMNRRSLYEMTTEFDVASICSILKSETIYCKIYIEVDDIVALSNIDIVKKVTECPICQENMLGHIYSCTTGHSICHECKKKLSKCPTCNAKFANTRNYALEELAEYIAMPYNDKKFNTIETLDHK